MPNITANSAQHNDSDIAVKNTSKLVSINEKMTIRKTNNSSQNDGVLNQTLGDTSQHGTLATSAMARSGAPG